VAQLEALVQARGESMSRVATQFVRDVMDKRAYAPAGEAIVPFADPLTDTNSDRQALWTEPLHDAEEVSGGPAYRMSNGESSDLIRPPEPARAPQRSPQPSRAP
jgi:hypothetical protein